MEVPHRLYFVKNKQRGRHHARLRHYVPTVPSYRSLIEPYISYGLTAWGQATNSNLNKILILQKRALRLMSFSDSRAQAIPLFVRSAVLSLNMLYFKFSDILMHDISNKRAPSRISELFVRSNMIHSHYTRFSAPSNFYVQRSSSISYYYLFLEVV